MLIQSRTVIDHLRLSARNTNRLYPQINFIYSLIVEFGIEFPSQNIYKHNIYAIIFNIIIFLYFFKFYVKLIDV